LSKNELKNDAKKFRCGPWWILKVCQKSTKNHELNFEVQPHALFTRFGPRD